MTNVAVLRGGPSDEYDVSMQTGAGVFSVLQDHPQFDPVDIVISKQGKWMVDGFEREPQNALATADVVFIALHGSYGEDGTVQRILERLSIPYTGSGSYASAIAMNKIIAKEHLKECGVSMAPHMRVTKNGAKNLTQLCATITSLFGPEYALKPMSGGSSIGTKMASSTDLISVLTELLETYDDILIEERIRGREATCGVLENFRGQTMYSLPVIEIVPPPKSDFFEADVKYTGETEEFCPGRFTKEQKNTLETVAKAVHQTLGLAHYSRSDFIVTDDAIYFLEVNTLPGLTEQSLLPKSIDAVGCSYSDFISHLLTEALHKN